VYLFGLIIIIRIRNPEDIF